MTFQPPRGTRDFMPCDMIKRQFIIDRIRSVFERWGFDPLSTPAFEDWALLSAKGGEAIKNEIYHFKDKSDRELGLRFDFTVPFARVVSSIQLAKPFRRYQIGPVWRYDRPGAGRYREFWQADIDIAGAPTGEADALCIAAACEALASLGIDFSIRVNNRKIVESLITSLGVEDMVGVLRVIDKLDKIGREGVSKELKEHVSQEKSKKIMEFITVKKLDDAKKIVKEKSGLEGIAEIEKILDSLDAFGVRNFADFDMSLVRGLEYYTGPVFEINANMGLSMGGGGRYDNLIEGFGGQKTPAVGISFGIDRVALALEKMDMPGTLTKIYIAPIGAARKECIKFAKELIDAGVPAEFDVMNRPISKQLDYANGKGIPFVVVVGEKEIASGKAMLRDMKTGKEEEVKLSDIKKIKALAGLQ